MVFTEIPLKNVKNKIVWLPLSTNGVDWDSLVILIKSICGFSDSYFSKNTIITFTDKVGRCFESKNEIEKKSNFSNSIPRSIKRLRSNNFKPQKPNKTYRNIEDIFLKIF